MCDGRCWIKPRRAGLTTEQITEAIRAILRDFGNNVIYQSDTQYKAISTLMKPTIDTYSRRVSWMREDYYSPASKKPVKSLELKSSVVELEGDYFLGGMIEALPTVASAADGKDAVLFVQDEFSKYESSSPYEMFEINKRAVNPDKVLKMDCLSTTGDSKDAAKATMDWHKLIANSNPNIRNSNGKTNSGLYKFFVKGIHSLLLLKEIPEVLDNYGHINEDMAENWIWNEHKKYPQGTREYIFSLYKLPLKEEHAMLSMAASNLFSKIRISARLTDLESLTPDEKPYVRGKLVSNAQGAVHFEPDPAGLWLWAVMPYFSVEKNIDLRNRFKKSYQGVYFPYKNPMGVIGYDPVNYPKATIKSSNFSQAALFIRQKFDYYNTGYNDEIMALYLGRPDDPHEVNHEAMKACRFTGFPCMHERSVAHVYEDFRDYNMLPFLMEGEDGHHGITTNPKIIRDGVAMLQARYSLPQDGEKDQIETYPFEDGLRSLDAFDPANTQHFDPTMAEIMCEHGLKLLTYTNSWDNAPNEQHVQLLSELYPLRNKQNNYVGNQNPQR
mgnify:CR=1 FL=1